MMLVLKNIFVPKDIFSSCPHCPGPIIVYDNSRFKNHALRPAVKINPSERFYVKRTCSRFSDFFFSVSSVKPALLVKNKDAV